jgi:20S proteasome alpha/beta subunit
MVAHRGKGLSMGVMFTGVLDSYYKWEMTMEQSIALGKRAINEAAYNDAASGGVVRGIFSFLKVQSLLDSN